MKPTVTQLYQAASAILSGLLANNYGIDPFTCQERLTSTAMEMAIMLAEKVPELDTLPEPDSIRKTLTGIFAEVNGRAIPKYQLSMLLQDRLLIGRRVAEHVLLWAESSKFMTAEVSGQSIRYSLA